MKVFVTIGSQDPFNRLIKIIDEIAPELQGVTFIAQITGTSVPVKNIRTVQFIAPVEFKNYLEAADIIVSHAGIGTILNVLELGKPLIVFPREGKFKETRDDHQIATMKALLQLGYVEGAQSGEELKEKLNKYLKIDVSHTQKIGQYASTQLLNELEQFILS